MTLMKHQMVLPGASMCRGWLRPAIKRNRPAIVPSGRLRLRRQKRFDNLACAPANLQTQTALISLRSLEKAQSRLSHKTELQSRTRKTSAITITGRLLAIKTERSRFVL